jgi:hypothetical protein
MSYVTMHNHQFIRPTYESLCPQQSPALYLIILCRRGQFWNVSDVFVVWMDNLKEHNIVKNYDYIPVVTK